MTYTFEATYLISKNRYRDLKLFFSKYGKKIDSVREIEIWLNREGNLCLIINDKECFLYEKRNRLKVRIDKKDAKKFLNFLKKFDIREHSIFYKRMYKYSYKKCIIYLERILGIGYVVKIKTSSKMSFKNLKLEFDFDNSLSIKYRDRITRYIKIWKKYYYNCINKKLNEIINYKPIKHLIKIRVFSSKYNLEVIKNLIKHLMNIYPCDVHIESVAYLFFVNKDNLEIFINSIKDLLSEGFIYLSEGLCRYDLLYNSKEECARDNKEYIEEWITDIRNNLSKITNIKYFLVYPIRHVDSSTVFTLKFYPNRDYVIAKVKRNEIWITHDNSILKYLQSKGVKIIKIFEIPGKFLRTLLNVDIK